MTNDIVARLRVWSRWLGERVPDSDVQDDIREAADEIERLRAARDGFREDYIHRTLDAAYRVVEAEKEIERLRNRLQKLEGRCSSAAFLLQAPIEEATNGSR